jgi:acetoin utilization deacetylase AcuC-like enzyme
MPEEHRRMSLSPAPPPPPPSEKHGARARAVLVDDVRFDAHRSTGYHPERPERLFAARRAIDASAIDWSRVAARPASDDELGRVHDPRFVDELEKLRGQTMHLDPDTYVAPGSIDAARLAAGGLVALVDAVIDGPDAKGVALLRPPGHHARPAHAMGFCLLNNVAVAAAHARARGVERVLIVDWDVHHGNGTQEIFWRDPHVLYASTHQFPFYPWTGDTTEVGEADGRGFTVNVPLTAGGNDATYRAAFERIILPVAEAFKPQLVLVSAGFDAAVRDPLAEMELSSDGFGWMAHALAEVADRSAKGKMILALEGGYDLASLEAGLKASIRGMLGDQAPQIERAPDAPDIARAVREAKHAWQVVE